MKIFIDTKQWDVKWGRMEDYYFWKKTQTSKMGENIRQWLTNHRGHILWEEDKNYISIFWPYKT